ncbi:hypothetical protein [Yersinia bercovieri]|uniref:hypothetical protein n=1 Tax=Yersinia bercovieri TaxID=634 RepID=UPI0011AB2FFF|nr:hypothetical protein [Yersinia bercovieri]
MLAPGSYFHLEHSGIDYPALPPVLQQAHNQRLLMQYQLPMPGINTLMLPDFMVQHWADLPKVAWALGILLHPSPLPWWAKTSRYAGLHHHLSGDFRQPQEKQSSPQTVLVTGAVQILASLAPFGAEYTTRASYMFSTASQQLMKVPVRNALPWNVIEGAYHYVREI